MELIPPLRLGWLNGWLLIGLLALTDGVLFALFPRDVVARLLDRSGWSQEQVTFTVLGKACALVCLVLVVLTPLKTGSSLLFMGTGIALVGLAGLVRALFDFKNTPLDEPVTRGLYRWSRHPQTVMASLVILGACIAVGSWLALALWVGARAFGHFGIVAEEEVCLRRYGEPYRAYLKRVPRYFMFF